MFKGNLCAGISGRVSIVKVLTLFLLSICSAFDIQAANPVQQSFSEFGSLYDFSESGISINTNEKFSAYEGLFPESVEKNATKAKTRIDAPRVLKDGERGLFAVRIIGGEATAYEWSYETRGKAKTQAAVDFSAPDAGATEVTARWYTRTNGNCAADFSSTYLIKLRVRLRSGDELLELFPLTVEVPHNWGGFVDYPETIGAPKIEFDQIKKLWLVTGAGTLERAIKQPVIRAPETSQFFHKIKTHEEIHLQQMQSGIFSDLFQIANLMPQLGELSDANRQSLEQKIFQTIQLWRKTETQIASARLPEAEKEAYKVSDKIAPRYLFNNCERFK